MPERPPEHLFRDKLPEAARLALTLLEARLGQQEADRFNLIPLEALGRDTGGQHAREALCAQAALLDETGRRARAGHVRQLEELLEVFEQHDMRRDAAHAARLLLRGDLLHEAGERLGRLLRPEPGSPRGASAPKALVLRPIKTIQLAGDLEIRHLCGLGDALVVSTHTSPYALLVLDAKGRTLDEVRFPHRQNSVFPCPGGEIGVCDQQGHSVHWFDRRCRHVRSVDLREAVDDGSSPRPLYGCHCGARFYVVVNRGGLNEILSLDMSGDTPRAECLPTPTSANYGKIHAHGSLMFVATSGLHFDVFTPCEDGTGLRQLARVPVPGGPYALDATDEHVLCSSQGELFVLNHALGLVGGCEVNERIIPHTPPPGRWPLVTTTFGGGRPTCWISLASSNLIQGCVLEAV